MTNNSDTDQIIDAFIDSIWLEQGLSKSTLSAYRSDINVLGKAFVLSLKETANIAKNDKQ